MKTKQVDSSNFHFLTPDYDRSLYNIPPGIKERMLDKLNFLYSHEQAELCLKEIDRLLKVYYAHKAPEMIQWENGFNVKERFTEKDVILITYGDLISNDGESPLKTLTDVCETYLEGVINTLHILPFFPYSSDRGFAVMDFEQVDPNLGTWDDITNLKTDFRLMFDAVFNHVSHYCGWFEEFLNQNPDYINFFESFDSKDEIPEEQKKLITRPRTSDLLTGYSTLNGKKYVWTTFSADQVDLNYKDPKVLTMMIDVMLYYVRRGADILRLDAVTYLWTELGTSSANLPQTHTIVKLFRDILDCAAPHVAIITESNVPFQENIKYFGNGDDEAQLIYNFALPPLVLHAFYSRNSSVLTSWAGSLKKVSDTATYFNFLDSHDGVSLQGAMNILGEEGMALIERHSVDHGGIISYKDKGDGTKVSYEVDITWFSAINKDDGKESLDDQINRFLASRSIALVLMGIPGVYLHGLLGSKNDTEAVMEGKSARSINRKSLNKNALIETLNCKDSITYQISSRYGTMISKRIKEKAFHPNAEQKVLSISDSVFSVLRTSTDRLDHILTITNITKNKLSIEFYLKEVGVTATSWIDVLSGKTYNSPEGKLTFNIDRFEVLWLKAS